MSAARGRLTGYVGGRRQQSPDQHHMSTAVKTAKTSPASWDAFADVDAFVDEVLAGLAAMTADGTKPARSGPKPALAGAALLRSYQKLIYKSIELDDRAVFELCS